MTPCYIALGSNLQQPSTQLNTAVEAINALADCELGPVSSFYRSPAIGPGEQPDYLNAVLKLDTTLTPIALLDALQSIETKQGRVRETRWGARTLDLDILLYGEQTIQEPRLTVPHPAMPQRNFVLYPLLEITGKNLMLPGDLDLGTLLTACPQGDLRKCADRVSAEHTTTGTEYLQPPCPELGETGH